MDKLENLSTQIAFDDLIQAGHDIVAGKVQGRVVATI